MGKRNTVFRFKHFSIDHAKSSMKVGTDGVLLGAWADVEDARNILDVGTGSGVIALMLAQRTSEDVLIDGVDIDPADVDQAIENISNSPWADRVRVSLSALQEWQPSLQYDVIVSNPPFFINSYAPPDKKREQSRHTATLSHLDILKAAQRLLSTGGRLSVILPTVEGIEFMKQAELIGFGCSRLFSFRPRKNKPVERWLIELTIGRPDITKGEIIMYEEGNEWTDGYKNLTRDFYLKN
jgi:tRNA1Val (adenine37-N6)-methyltransferase